MANGPNASKLQEFLGKVVGDVRWAMSAALVKGLLVGIANGAVLLCLVWNHVAQAPTAPRALPEERGAGDVRGMSQAEPCGEPEPPKPIEPAPKMIGFCPIE